MGVEPTIFCLGGRRVSTAPRDLMLCNVMCFTLYAISFSCLSYFSSKENKGKASAGVEPTTFRLLGERTANYAKRPYPLHIFSPFLFSPFSYSFLILFFLHFLFFPSCPCFLLFIYSSTSCPLFILLPSSSPRLLCLAPTSFSSFLFSSSWQCPSLF